MRYGCPRPRAAGEALSRAFFVPFLGGKASLAHVQSPTTSFTRTVSMMHMASPLPFPPHVPRPTTTPTICATATKSLPMLTSQRALSEARGGRTWPNVGEGRGRPCPCGTSGVPRPPLTLPHHPALPSIAAHDRLAAARDFKRRQKQAMINKARARGQPIDPSWLETDEKPQPAPAPARPKSKADEAPSADHEKHAPAAAGGRHQRKMGGEGWGKKVTVRQVSLLVLAFFLSLSPPLPSPRASSRPVFLPAAGLRTLVAAVEQRSSAPPAPRPPGENKNGAMLEVRRQ